MLDSVASWPRAISIRIMTFLVFQYSLLIAKHFHLCFAILPPPTPGHSRVKKELLRDLLKITQLVRDDIKTNSGPLTLSQACLLHNSSHPLSAHSLKTTAWGRLCLAGTASFEGQRPL